MRAVILPATPLLLDGVAPGLRRDPLAPVRAAVRAALAELTAELTSGGGLPSVLAHGPALRQGRLRPSLAGSGISDRWLPDASTGRLTPAPDDGLPPAGTGASVALLALAEVLGARTADVETLEVPPHGAVLDERAAGLLRRTDGLVVAGGGAPGGPDSSPGALTDGLRAALRAAGADGWTADVQVFEVSHDHLPPEYRVTILS
ncbi:hypothetical protein [Promicromonospora iranensis]|uniref:Uncharacterized protein n=1 Tax=Promicromonospora iranensis TaxID=1105144 RepID=A0ABU2CJE3_9MICO|nr:hypothetical protein [Promicromonospora iranensis]MDR7381449.1 hypothetical protein [Promicromonospora iranensis]